MNTGDTIRLLPALQKMNLNKIRKKFPIELQQGYVWHRKENEQLFLDNVEALTIVYEHGVKPQITSYVDILMRLFNKDKADEIHDAVLEQTGYDGWYAEHPSNLQPASDNGYRLHATLQLSATDQAISKLSGPYSCQKIGDFNQTIPLDVLRTVSFVKNLTPQPDSYWVVIRYEGPRHMFLCVRFGGWLISIATW